MEPTGFGLKFTDNDLLMAQRVKTVLDTFEFKLDGAKQVVEVAQALAWYVRLIPEMEKNVFELISQTKVPDKKEPKKGSRSAAKVGS